jgi:HK97 family phage major capsid protein
VANNMPLIVGDLSHYIIGQRTQITSVILRERFADSDQLGIILFERVGGGAYNFDAFRGGIV